jgi:hypothetical protein
MRARISEEVSAQERDLLLRLDAALSAADPGKPELLARAALDICQFAKIDGDPELGAAVEIAADYLAGRVSDKDRSKAAAQILTRGDNIRRRGEHLSAEWCKNQLVAQALDNSTPTSSYSAEFLIEFARRAGAEINIVDTALTSLMLRISNEETQESDR